MRTKTPKQIFEQWERIKKNAATPTNIDRAKRAVDISRRYWDNIYNAHGVDGYGDFEKSNEIWYTAAEPASVYAKQ